MKKTIRMNLAAALTLALSLFATLPSAFAKGGKDGGGADYIVNTPMWFMSSVPAKRIRACADVAAGFSVPKDVIASAIRESFEKWEAYLKRSGIFAAMGQQSIGLPDSSGKMVQYSGLRPVTALDLAFGCRGGEDLRILLGVMNSEVSERKKHYGLPFAFSETSSPIPTEGARTFWNPGMIWIAPDRSVLPQYEVPTWTAQDYHPFRQLLIHEVGHIMGVGHIDGTLMGMRLMNDLAERTQKQSSRTGNNYGKRDLEIEQYSELHVGNDFETEMVVPNYVVGSEATVFKRLVGRAPVGKVKVRARRSPPSGPVLEETSDVHPRDVKIFLTDERGTTTITLQERMKIGEDRNRSAPVFYTPFGSYDFQAFSFAGVLHAATGEDILVASNYNLNYTRYEIRDIGQITNLDPNSRILSLLVSD